MQIRKFLTLAFERNVGFGDRLFRLVSGGLLMMVGWWLGWSPVFATGVAVLGAMWFATGVLSKCSIYYLLGYSTHASSTGSSPSRAPKEPS